MKRTIKNISLLLVLCIALSACATASTQKPTAESTVATGGQTEPVTIEYWAYADYASGEAGELQKTFIAEFEAANPGVKINMAPKNDDELLAGIAAAAASKTLPDLYMQSSDMGALDIKLNGLDDVSAKWVAEPETLRNQFNPQWIDHITVDGKMWGVPYTGFSSFVFRNLTVLKAAGIDPNEKVENWEQWLAQMKKIKDAGYLALGRMSDASQDFVAAYSGIANENEWGIDWANKKTLLNPEKYAELNKFLLAANEYGTENGNRDQAAADLFLSNKIAYLISGPWTNVKLADAKKTTGLEYDFVLIPGSTADNFGGHAGFEFIGFAPNNENVDIAWKFVMYICDEPQQTRWATLLSRLVSNQDTLLKIPNDALLQITAEGAKSGLFTQPPDFVKAYPSGYNQAILDNMVKIEEGQFTPEEGAQQLITTLNQIIQDSD